MIFRNERPPTQARREAIKHDVQQLKPEAAELGRRSTHLALALSLICSLTAVAIVSKTHLTNHLWVNVAAFAVPIPIALFFKNRIVFFGAFAYVAALILFLSAAILFGI